LADTRLEVLDTGFIVVNLAFFVYRPTPSTVLFTVKAVSHCSVPDY